MLRRAWLVVFVCVAACTPIRGLDVPGDDSGARFDAAGVDAAAADGGPDASAIDGGVDAGCSTVDRCDGVDDDCDPSTPDGSSDPDLGMPCDGPDSDGCTEGTITGCALGVPTCSDTTADSLETCDFLTMMDEDCDGAVDEADAIGTVAYYPDEDGDGYGDDAGVMMLCAPPMGGRRFVTMGGDCDDTDNSVRPGRSENCDGIDQDCDGTIDDGAMCDFGCTLHTYEGHAYQLCAMTRQQSGAKSRCMSYGYHLVQIDDALENEFVHSILGSGFPLATDVWIGLESSGGTPPVFTWPDGTTPTYTAWSAGEPNASGNCARMLDSGLWADAPCGTSYAYLCEAP